MTDFSGERSFVCYRQANQKSLSLQEFSGFWMPRPHK